MTALNEYERLECAGVWRAAPDAQRRDVFVSVGDATLVIYDKGARALAHWSLAAIERINPGSRPALYRPGSDAPEELELDDDLLIGAIERVRRAVARRRPREGRLRLYLLTGALAAVLVAGALWLPDALVRSAAEVVPAAKRAEIGERLLATIRRVAERPCDTREGRRALERLHARLLPDAPGRLVVLGGISTPSEHLPGGLILLNRSLVEDVEDPAAVAGYVLAEAARSDTTDPMLRLLRDAGPVTAFRLLTTGDVDDDTLAAHAETLLTAPPAPVPDEAMLAAFAGARVSSQPYAYARDISGETTLALIEADPMRDAAAQPVLPDGAWVSLQGICGE